MGLSCLYGCLWLSGYCFSHCIQSSLAGLWVPVLLLLLVDDAVELYEVVCLDIPLLGELKKAVSWCTEIMDLQSLADWRRQSRIAINVGVPKPGCFKPRSLQFLRGSALLCSFAPFCALLRTCTCAFLRSCARICVFLRPAAFRTTASGNCRDFHTERTVFGSEIRAAHPHFGHRERPTCPEHWD